MTPAEYKAHRSKVGTQTAVAAMLEIHRTTVQKREAGSPRHPITREAALAILKLSGG